MDDNLNSYFSTYDSTAVRGNYCFVDYYSIAKGLHY